MSDPSGSADGQDLRPEAVAAPIPAPDLPVIGAPRAEFFDRTAWLWVLAATGVAAALRLGYVLRVHPPSHYLYSDMEGFLNQARAFAQPHHVMGLWDTVKPRAMGLTGALMIRLFPLHSVDAWGVTQALLSAATLPLVYLGVRRCLGTRPALIATGLTGLHFLFISFTGFLMAETYVTFLMALSLALLVPERPLSSLGAGIALGLATCFKAQAFVLLPLWAILLWGVGHSSRRRLLKFSAVALAAGTLLVVVPESVVISRVAGHPTFLSTYGGQNVYVGHCHVKLLTCDGGPLGVFYSGVPKVYQRNEPWPDVTFPVSVFDSGFYVREGLACFTQSFGFAAGWLIQQLADVFAGWPSSTIDPWPESATGFWIWNRVANLAVAYCFAPLAFVGLWLGRRRLGTWLAFGMPMASVLAIAVVFSGDPRYREPFDFFIFGAAGLAIEIGLARVKERRARSAHP
jgi:4-amino-4-deoxy-L-arabinose transferase-like glycosyltransferase